MVPPWNGQHLTGSPWKGREADAAPCPSHRGAETDINDRFGLVKTHASTPRPLKSSRTTAQTGGKQWQPP